MTAINNSVLDVIKKRRSTRAFLPQQISREELTAILEAGCWAPTGHGHQGWHFTALYNADVVGKLAAAVRQELNLPDTYCFYGAPCLIIVSYEREYEHAWLDGSAAIQNLLLAAESLGIESCWINQVRQTCDAPAMRRLLTELGVPTDHVVIGSVALGHGAAVTAPKPRKEGVVNIVE
ncbi:MAG: nitroreductase [Firmicutes bacterium]|nr:nitroreductase [Bacillota bacterium]